MTKSRIFFWLLVSFIAGVVIASFTPIPLTAVWVFFIVSGAVVAWGIFTPDNRKQSLVIGFSILFLAGGMLRFFSQVRVPESDLPRFVGQEIERSGVILEDPVRSATNQRVVLTLDSGDTVLLVTGLYPRYQYGERLHVSGKLKEPENFSDTFDYRAYLAKDNIYYLMSFPKIEITGENEGSAIYAFLFHLKHAFAEKLNELLPEPHSSFMAGLILGERRSLPSDIVVNLQTTGTSHVVALSGYNITIIGDALMRALSFLAVPFSWAFFGSVFGIAAFTALTGAQASVVRAAIMGVLVLIAKRVGRTYHIRNALTLAAAVMLFQNPKVFRFDIGFELSFLATLGLVYGSPLIEKWYEQVKLKLIPPLRDAKLVQESREIQKGKKPSVVRGVLISTLSAQLFVIPILVYRFGKLSLVSPFANIAILPLIPATMLFGFFAGSLAFVSSALAHVFGLVSWFFLGYELGAISFFAKIPFAALEVSGAAPVIVSAIYLGVLAIIFRRHARK